MLDEAAADDARLAGPEQWRRRGRLLQRTAAEGGEQAKHLVGTSPNLLRSLGKAIKAKD